MLMIDSLPRDEIVALYGSGASLGQIGERFGLTKYETRRALIVWRALSVVDRRVVSEEALCEWKSLYASGLSFAKIGKLHGVSQGTVHRHLALSGIRLREPFELAHRCVLKKHTLNENAFDCIDTQECAYWLGFLLADGYVSQKHRKLSINLQRRDAGHLYKLKSFLGATHGVNFHKQTYYEGSIANFTVTSGALTAKLRSHGMIAGNKTIADVPQALVRHYLRGAVDGDGTVRTQLTKRKRGGVKYESVVELVGTLETMELFRGYCISIVNTKASIEKRIGMYCYRLKGPMALDVIESLYRNSSVSLTRKAERAMESAMYTTYERSAVLLESLQHSANNAWLHERSLLAV